MAVNIPMYTIFHASDGPFNFIVRKGMIGRVAQHDPREIWEAGTIEDARSYIPTGFVISNRKPEDSPNIVETHIDAVALIEAFGGVTTVINILIEYAK